MSRGLEVKLRAPTEFATELVGARSNFGGYLDTAFSDANTESERTFGWGVADASVFRLGETYSVTFDVSGGTGNPSTAYGVELSFQATSDSHYPGLSDPFRMFGDYNYKYLRAVDFKIARFSSQSITAAQNLLYAQSFEEGNQSFDVYSFLDAGNNRAVYCNRLQGYGSDCYLEFNRGTATKASVRQTVPVAVHASDNLTAEARVRCPSGQGSCPITLAIWGLGGERESRSISCTIPASDEWWAIRLDGDNGFEQGFAYDHSAVMWELYNEGDATTNLDVDYTALANGYSVAVRGVNFQPTASSGPACQQADMSNT